MKTRRVNRYYCDYCKKSGGSKYWIVEHEKHCTNNPNRKCRMCEELGENQTPIAELTAILPNPDDFKTEDEHGYIYSGVEDAIEKIMPKLEAKANFCPMCIFSALRQAGLTSVGYSYPLSEKLKETWAEINAHEYKIDLQGTYYGELYP